MADFETLVLPHQLSAIIQVVILLLAHGSTIETCGHIKEKRSCSKVAGAIMDKSRVPLEKK
jgi:hypothetical protein